MTKKIIKYLLCIALGVILAIPFFASKTQAQNLVSNGDTGLSAFLGDQHAYSVTVKHNDSIAVMARIVFANSTDKAKADYILGLPEGLTGQVLGIQQILGRECTKQDFGTTASGDKCLELSAPDYWNYRGDYYDLNEKNDYKKVAITSSGNELKISLPVAIEPGGGGAVILSYYQTGQIKTGWFGTKTLKFQSIADLAVVKSISVAVSSDSDIYTSSGRSTVSELSGSAAPTSLAVGATSSKSMDLLSSGIIDSYGAWLNKSGTDFIPNERFEVTGKFSASWLGMYWVSVAIGLLVLIGIIVLAFFVLRKPTLKPGQPINEKVSPEHPIQYRENIHFRDAMTWREIFVSLIVLLVGIGFPAFASYLINRILGYNSPYIITELASIGLFLFGATIVLGYLIFRGVRYGIGAAIASFISYIIWFVIAFIIFAATLKTSTDSGMGSGTTSGGISTPGIEF